MVAIECSCTHQGSGFIYRVFFAKEKWVVYSDGFGIDVATTCQGVKGLDGGGCGIRGFVIEFEGFYTSKLILVCLQVETSNVRKGVCVHIPGGVGSWLQF